jgi:Flp pilus assembly pilin Flp
MKGSKMQMLKKFMRDDQGLETVEYAIIAGLIVVGTVATITAIGVWVANKFTDVKTALNA